MNSLKCKHVKQFFATKTNTIAYETILRCLTFPRSEKAFIHKATLRCASCKNGTASIRHNSDDVLVRPKCLLACAHCIYFGCWDGSHIHAHHKDHPGHTISVCLERGELYCADCRDFVYHPVAETFLNAALRSYMAQFGLTSHTWRPSFAELEYIPHITPVVPFSVKFVNRPTRGLINMGNTCFLNVVIQALTHTPVLRDYLLADLHRCENLSRSRNCLACEMVRITQEIYRPVLTPFVPNNLLYSIWLNASHFAGYEQRDAHEFLITLLTLIHSHLVGEQLPHEDGSVHGLNVACKTHSKEDRIVRTTTCSHDDYSNTSLTDCVKSSSVNGLLNPMVDLTPQPDSNSQMSSSSTRDSAESCDCIVHQVFFGDLESVISYEGCEHKSLTVDPFLDLSLDVIQRGSTSLQACLKSYFSPELIDGLIICSQCNVGRPAVKQFNLLHLPNVLCFYLKRCHHDTKINTSIDFPVELDLAPYLNPNEDRSCWQDRYSLYAVLNHSGQTNSGHYIAYIRFGTGSWCLCDDQKIIPVSLQDVLNTGAYVLLYHKNLLAIRI